jgi:hypothetical protein
VKGPPLVRFELGYNPLVQADKDTLKAALTSAKGEFSADLSLTTDIEFDNLSLDSDEFVAVEEKATQYGVKWAVTQTLAQSLSYGSYAAGYGFPVLSSGCIGQRPFIQKKRFQTISSKMPSGPKYTYAEFAGGLSGGFPSNGLMAWELGYVNLTDAEVTAFIQHFLAQWGDCLPFTFTDEDGTAYSNVHYASPELKIVRQQYNQSSMHIALIQTA